ncbi:hypothetical protein HOY80DRAFT_858801, partial [Tuber brumale]
MATTKRLCIGVACANPISTLQCPTCLKLGKESFFCSQDCFKSSWSEHKIVHKQSTQTGIYDPFPNFPYTGGTRPAYPLSPTRKLPPSIRRPDYSEDGVPKS